VNETQQYFPQRRFVEVVEKHADKNALIFYTEKLPLKIYTYQELYSIVKKYAYCLTNLNINKGDVVAVYLPRGPEYIFCMLAIWQIGAIYMPITDTKTSDFNHNRLTVAGAKYLITDKAVVDFAEHVQPIPIVELETTQLPNECELKATFPGLDFKDYAYIVSSSGTTGHPKVIINRFDGLAGRIESMSKLLQIKVGSVVLNYTGFDFDASILDVWMTLLKGACLIVASQSARTDFAKLAKIFRYAREVLHQAISTAVLLPYVLRGLVKEIGKAKLSEYMAGLETFTTMGEECNQSILQPYFEHLPGLKVFNGYGPSEATIAASMGKITTQMRKYPLGRPLEGVKFFVFIKENEPVPLSLPSQEKLAGELGIGGMGVGCYLNKEDPLPAEELNKTHFCDDNKFGRIYKTKDYVYTENGELYFSHRIDGTIKINGSQVCVKEIENALAQALNFIDLEGKIITNDSNHLFAFFQFNALLDDDLEKKFNQAIAVIKPANWRPSFCFKVDKLPKTDNDKFSRNIIQLLQVPSIQYLPREKVNKQSIFTEFEKEIAKIWCRVLFNFKEEVENLVGEKGVSLGSELFTLESNFWEWGGNSINFIELVREIEQLIEKKTKRDIHLSQMSENWIRKYATIQHMATMVYYQCQEVEPYTFSDKPPCFYLQLIASSAPAIPLLNNNDLKKLSNNIYFIRIQTVQAEKLYPNNEKLTKYLAGIIIDMMCTYQSIGPYHLMLDQQSSNTDAIVSFIRGYLNNVVYVTYSNEVFNSEQPQENFHYNLESRLQSVQSEQCEKVLRNRLEAYHHTIAINSNNNSIIKLELIKNIIYTDSNKIFYLEAPIGSGKTNFLLALQQQLKSSVIISIYLDLANKSEVNFSKLAPFSSLTKAELQLLKTQCTVVILCDHYDWMSRKDYPNLLEKLQQQALCRNVKLVVATTPGNWPRYDTTTGKFIRLNQESKKLISAAFKSGLIMATTKLPSVENWLRRKFDYFVKNHPRLKQYQKELTFCQFLVIAKQFCQLFGRRYPEEFYYRPNKYAVYFQNRQEFDKLELLASPYMDF
jgi:acyl-coenzyme A synthetase/AMP-(fatty) acid ligase